jgi:hypothetical protein
MLTEATARWEVGGRRSATRGRAALVVARVGELTKNPHGGSVHRSRKKMEILVSRWVLMGKELPRGTEEDVYPDAAHQRGG